MAEFRIAPNPLEEEIAYVADNMRLADVAEVWALSRLKPHDALDISVRLTKVPYVAYDGLRPVAVFGVASVGHLGRTGSPWLLGTDRVYEGAKFLMRMTPRFVSNAFRTFERLENYVHAENHAAIRYLRRAGFQLSEPRVLPNGSRAFRFTMEKEHV